MCKVISKIEETNKGLKFLDESIKFYFRLKRELRNNELEHLLCLLENRRDKLKQLELLNSVK